MGCGQSKIKRSNTTPITIRESKQDDNKDYQNHWHNDRPVTDRNKNRDSDWNVESSKTNSKGTVATGRGSIELYDSSGTKQKQSDEKNKDAQMKIRRQKTEQLVNKLHDHPDLIAEQSKEILTRLENTKIEKSKRLDQIDPKITAKVTPVESDNKSQHKRKVSLADILENSQQEIEPENLPKNIPKANLNINLPGAAVIERTVISYGDQDNKRSKTTRRRVDSESDDDITNQKRTPIVVQSKQGIQKVTVHQTSISNNDSTLIGTQERQRNNVINNQNGPIYKDKKDELDGLLKELNEDDSDDGLIYNKINKESAIRVVQGSFEPNEPSECIFGENEDQFSPDKQYGLQALGIGDYEIKDEDEDYNFAEANIHDSNIMHFDGKEGLEYEPKTSIFNYNENHEIFQSDHSNHNKSRNMIMNEQIESPKQLNLNELLDDDFDVENDHSKFINTKQTPKQTKENDDPLNDDFLNEFEW